MTDEDRDPLHASPEEERDIAENGALTAVSVYGIIHEEGIEELARPLSSLWWSGVAAGLAITASVVAEGVLHGIFNDHPYRPAIENLGYTVGFVIVILGRFQLFTENTLTVILPLLVKRSGTMLLAIARLWAIVLLANFVGTFLAMGFALWGGAIPMDHIDGMLAVSRHLAEKTPMESFTHGVPAGFYVAALVWMLPSARGAPVLVIVIMTYLIAAGDFTHVIAGSGELFLLWMAGELPAGQVAALLLPTLAGNILGGTGLFALLAYGQVAGEIER
ncbi:formate/nitrite transporter family protein [Mesobacterium pallidum]|uniref:formate/nitrite transporter family protein n=1 Tax=Mesobacterium pallidum TaxID=2872037 RepID=UPI001EE233C2|nr:formate/nitrite transporter family protein [Mesobacterium pallidum]